MPSVTRRSNPGEHIVLDVDERLRDVESQFSNLKDVMFKSLAEREPFDKEVELAKARGKSLYLTKNEWPVTFL